MKYTPHTMNFSQKDVLDRLSTVIDPELNVDIVSMGLIYEIKIETDVLVIRMTLTTPSCPLAPVIHQMVEECLEDLPEYNKSKLDLQLVFDPPWTVEMMKEEIRIELGLDEF